MALDTPPQYVYRVQDEQSFTYYDKESGFETYSRYRDTMRPCFWLNRSKLLKHLDWNGGNKNPIKAVDRSEKYEPHLSLCPEETSPFISVFERADEALRRKAAHQHWGRSNVFVTKISTARMRHKMMDIEFSDCVCRLPTFWDSETDAVMFKVVDAAALLGVQLESKHKASEWLFIEYIPRELFAGML